MENEKYGRIAGSGPCDGLRGVRAFSHSCGFSRDSEHVHPCRCWRAGARRLRWRDHVRRVMVPVRQDRVSRCMCSPDPRQRRTLPEDGAWLGYVTPGRWPPPHALKSRKARNQSIQRSPPVPLPSTWFLSL